MALNTHRSISCIAAPFLLAVAIIGGPVQAQTGDGQVATTGPAIAAPAAANCPAQNASANEDLALINRLAIEPGKIGNLMDMLKAMPPGAMARLADLQKAAAEQQKKDWPNLCRYAEENAQVLASGTRIRVIFLGDSITENWKIGDPSLFDADRLAFKEVLRSTHAAQALEMIEPLDPDGKLIDPATTHYTIELHTRLVRDGSHLYRYFDRADAVRY